MVGPWPKSATEEYVVCFLFRGLVYTYCRLVRKYSAKISRLVRARPQVDLRVSCHRPFYFFDDVFFKIADVAYCEVLQVELCTVHTRYYDGIAVVYVCVYTCKLWYAAQLESSRGVR